MRATALRRISALTGTDSHPLSRSCPIVAGRFDMVRKLPPSPPFFTRSDPVRPTTFRGGRNPARERAVRRPVASAVMDLGGEWRAAIADEDLRRTWLDTNDDHDWDPVTVP